MGSIRFGIPVFLGSFLLFQVQPIVGKGLLPWFGGGASIWMSCLLFFQVCLLIGYGYAHGLGTRVPSALQPWIHSTLLLLSMLCLPLASSAAPLGPDPWQHPVLAILTTLTIQIGAPFVLLSANAPLIQRWFHDRFPARSPYRLYALSNAGSLLGLLSYPFLFEPWIGLPGQALQWSGAYVVFAVLCALCAFSVRGRSAQAESMPILTESAGWQRWLALSACGSMLLMATTGQLSLRIPPTPFVWVIPLALYLISFILTFEKETDYDRRRWVCLFAIGIAALVVIAIWEFHLPILFQVAAYGLVLLSGGMLCHGELHRSRPAATDVTRYYLFVAGGGALGGFLISIVAPLVFESMPDYPLVLSVTVLLVGHASGWLPRMMRTDGRRAVAGVAAMVLAVTSPAWTARVVDAWTEEIGRGIETTRNFYGVFEVTEIAASGPWTVRWLRSGRIAQGAQYTAPQLQDEPLAYYGAHSGLGLSIARVRSLRRLEGRERLHIGMVGLGVGTVATFLEPGDRLRFYEINPEIARIADEHFSFLRHSDGVVEIVLGDARRRLEQELNAGQHQDFDVLALDAFNSDTIPVHLLTQEAFEIYRQHLRQGGVIAIHTTSDHLDLVPVALGIARTNGFRAYRVQEFFEPWKNTMTNEWVLLTENTWFRGGPSAERFESLDAEEHRPLVWTDDRHSLLRVIGWR